MAGQPIQVRLLPFMPAFRFYLSPALVRPDPPGRIPTGARS